MDVKIITQTMSYKDKAIYEYDATRAEVVSAEDGSVLATTEWHWSPTIAYNRAIKLAFYNGHTIIDEDSVV